MKAREHLDAKCADEEYMAMLRDRYVERVEEEREADEV
jgi:hypothetical protein